MLRQTGAIFLDAYRELNSRKLFWIVMALSVIVVLAFALVGINDKGLTVLWFTIPSGPFNAKLFPPEVFYKLMFANLGVKFWLAWASTILALVATAGMIPDLIASGSIELTLSKPIGRLRLFLTKFASGLLFTTVQVSLFTGSAFLVLGFRGGVWELGLFWTVPLMVVFYSYLFAICVLLGVITRSTVASLLLTLLAWFGIFGVHTTERTLMMFRERNNAQVERLEQGVAASQERVNKQEDGTAKFSVSNFVRGDPKVELERRQKKLVDVRADGRQIRNWHLGAYSVKTTLPKTTETLDLLERVLISQADLEQLQGDEQPVQMDSDDEDVRVDMRKVGERVQEKLRARPVAWVIGTSLAFEALVLGIAAWIFCRRDF